jgi:hypothetical protein
MTAVYNGDSADASSTSAAVKVTVNGLVSSAKLAVNDRDFSYGFRPTLTATVAPTAATGTATFRDGSRVLGTVSLSKGKAVLRAPLLARGPHSLTVTYNGSGVYNPAKSAAVSVVVR